MPLLKIYREELGEDKVCWAPVEDFYLCGYNMLTKRILPFLKETDERAVVHCSGGSGRTGHVLAAWLVAGRGFSVERALAAVVEMGRNPHEAVEVGNATEGELHALLERCRNDR